jgi:hypothetical protein
MKTIYTVPLAFSHDALFSDVTRDFGDYRCAIPVLTLFTIDGQCDEPGWQIAHEILARRLESVEMSIAIQDLLIAGSGGVLSILFTLCYNACVLASARKSGLSEVIAHEALKDYQERFYIRLREDDYVTASQKLPNRMPKVDDRFLSLVYANCILQYSTEGKSWYDLHPLVRELVIEWQAVRQAEQGTQP